MVGVGCLLKVLLEVVVESFVTQCLENALSVPVYLKTIELVHIGGRWLCDLVHALAGLKRMLWAIATINSCHTGGGLDHLH